MRLLIAIALLVSLFACAAQGPPQSAAALPVASPSATFSRPPEPPRAASSCATDRDCPQNEHCLCPAAGHPDRQGHTVCGGPYLCYPPGAAPEAMP